MGLANLGKGTFSLKSQVCSFEPWTQQTCVVKMRSQLRSFATESLSRMQNIQKLW